MIGGGGAARMRPIGSTKRQRAMKKKLLMEVLLCFND
jgi:hypothetical protein